MSSVCISSCVNDARDPRVPTRASYINLNRWPESDAEFINSVRRVTQGLNDNRPRVVDSVSCRQIYLRSYSFSRKEGVAEKTRKCIGKVKEKVANKKREQRGRRSYRKDKCFVLVRRALFRIFNRFLSCAASVDVAHPN